MRRLRVHRGPATLYNGTILQSEAHANHAA